MIRIFVAFALLLLACNDRAEVAETVPPDSSSKPEAVAIDSSADPNILTQAEINDDSVFADGSRPTSWLNAGISDVASAKIFVKHLKHLVKNNLKDSVALMIQYPLRNPPAKNKEEFLAGYDTYFNEKVKQALATQNLRQIFRRDQGAMIGNGEIWFRQTTDGFRIVAINN